MEFEKNDDDLSKYANILKENSQNINIMRSIAIICLLILHTQISEFLDMGIIKSGFFININYSFTVPVFMFLSGFCLTCRYIALNLSPKQFYEIKLGKTIYLYVLWGSINFSLVYYGNLILNYSFIEIFSFKIIVAYLLSLTISILTGNILTLWFLYVLILNYLIFPFLVKFLHKFDLTYILKSFLFLVIGYIILIFIHVLFYPLFFMKENLVLFQFTYFFEEIEIDFGIISYFLPNFLYFFLGMIIVKILNDSGENFHKFLKIMYFSPIIYILNGIFYDQDIGVLLLFVMNICSILVLTSLFIKRNSENHRFNKIGKSFEKLGKLSGPIYYSHRLIQALIVITFYFLFSIKIGKPFDLSQLNVSVFYKLGLTFVDFIFVLVFDLIFIILIQKSQKCNRFFFREKV